ncbi:hypothetical protein FS837_012785 [Tulasnella sp. UAMH 9824]|nr:hypothetical protein FS837_012785 [Tulasnella sp. UAMH 9824]
MYIVQSRLNHEDFNDDPEALMELPLSDKTSEFWKRYDRLADTHDTKMTEDLSENLDVLLIFAALFSAINTAFISLTMPGLSSDPLTETNGLLRLLVTRADNNTLVPTDLSPPFTPSPNSVIVNCLLYASLSCSLLAAVAAMMAKEWLQSFDRTGQTGPLEEQGRFRQRKFNGVQQWHLEPIIRSLPNILLLSVIFFFLGICLFLFPVNKAVAGVVIAFSIGGAILCGATIVAGAMYPLCPYQSAASRVVKRMVRLFSPHWWKDLAHAFADIVCHRLPKFVRKILDVMHQVPSIASAITGSVPTELVPTPSGKDEISEQVVVPEAVRWLLQTTSNHGDRIAATQFICTLGHPTCVMTLDDPKTWGQFLSLTREMFDIWHSRPTEMIQETVELLGLTLCHFIHDPVKIKDISDPRLYQSGSFGGNFLQAFEFASKRYSCYQSKDKELILHIAFLLAIISRGSVISEYRWIGLSRFFLTGNTPHLVDVLLNLWAKIFCGVEPDKSSSNKSYKFGELVDEGSKRISLVRDLSNTVICGTRVLPSLRGNLQSELHAIHGYTACLRRAAELSIQIPSDELTNVIDGVAGFILSYLDPLISSTPGELSVEMVRLSMEAVLALRAFVDRNNSPDEIPNSPETRAGQLRIDYFINAAVQIMLIKSEGLATSKLLPGTHAQALPWAQAHVLAPLKELVRERQELAREQALEKLEALEEAEALEELEALEERVRALEEGVRALEEGEPALKKEEREREGEREERERALELAWARTREQGRTLGWAVGQALSEVLPDRLAGLADRLSRQVLRLAKDFAQRLQVESSILRILLWAWKRSSGNQLDHSHKREIFITSCRLWAPLETRVDYTINGIEWGINGERLTFNDGNRDKLLTSDDLNGIVDFVEYLQKDRENSEFIARNADVGINRLYVHFSRQVDWNYDLYDFREQRTFCPRSREKGLGMIW